MDIKDAADKPRTSPAVPPTSDKNSKLVYSGFPCSKFELQILNSKIKPGSSRTNMSTDPCRPEDGSVSSKS